MRRRFNSSITYGALSGVGAGMRHLLLFPRSKAPSCDCSSGVLGSGILVERLGVKPGVICCGISKRVVGVVIVTRCGRSATAMMVVVGH